MQTSRFWRSWTTTLVTLLGIGFAAGVASTAKYDQGASEVRSPKTNGFVERMNRTLLDERFRVKGKETWYTATDEIQRDLDQFIEHYNLRRSHQGYRLNGRTPAQALRESLGIDNLPPVVPVATAIEEVNDADTVAA